MAPPAPATLTVPRRAEQLVHRQLGRVDERAPQPLRELGLAQVVVEGGALRLGGALELIMPA